MKVYATLLSRRPSMLAPGRLVLFRLADGTALQWRSLRLLRRGAATRCKTPLPSSAQTLLWHFYLGLHLREVVQPARHPVHFREDPKQRWRPRRSSSFFQALLSLPSFD